MQEKASKTLENTGYLRDFSTPKYSTPQARSSLFKQWEKQAQKGQKTPEIAAIFVAVLASSVPLVFASTSTAKKPLQEASYVSGFTGGGGTSRSARTAL
jgi:hypothetical protein